MSGLSSLHIFSRQKKTERTVNVPTVPIILAWGKRVSGEFAGKVIKISKNLEIKPSDLMAAMAFESNKTFSPSQGNESGSTAVGLIQFMPATAVRLGTTIDRLVAMTAVEQLDYVQMYFIEYKGKLKTLADLYMAILWPAGIGQPEDYVLFHRDDPKRPKLYGQNSQLDFNKDGNVTKREAAAIVQRYYQEGLKTENVLTIYEDVT